jgi:hypothetical protein
MASNPLHSAVDPWSSVRPVRWRLRLWNDADGQPLGAPDPPAVEQQFTDRPENAQDKDGRHNHEGDNLHGNPDRRLIAPKALHAEIRTAQKNQGQAATVSFRFRRNGKDWMP